MIKKIKQSVTFLILMFVTLNAYAWWSLGHMVVANIAYQNLNSKAKNKVDLLLLEFRKAYPDIKTVEQMAVWPDLLNWKQKIYLHAHWHYIDNPILADRTLSKTRIDTDNAVWALETIIQSLKENQAPVFEQSRLLAFLIHIVGDIHQPLHNVTRISAAHPNGDRGGNDYEIIYNGESVNLHQVWDTGFGLYTGDDTPNHIKEISQYLTSSYPVNFFGSKVNNLTPAFWSAEGINNAKKYVYTTPENQMPNMAYHNTGKQISKELVALAGYRLAALLNNLFG